MKINLNEEDEELFKILDDSKINDIYSFFFEKLINLSII
jgi:hypothetical protein